MALEDIQKKIISDAEQKKVELMKSAEQQVTEILDTAKKNAQSYQEDHHKNALSLAENLERGLIIDARRKLANEKLARKREKIEQTFAQAKSEFISSADYSKIMKQLVSKSIVSKKEQIVVGKNEQHLNQQWLDEVNKSNNSTLTFSNQKGEFNGGVILMEGETFVNITIDTLFALLRENTEKPVADMLFGG